MNKLSLSKRVQILNMLVEGSSMRTISRVVDVSFNRSTPLPSSWKTRAKPASTSTTSL